jgi:uncharacterized protein (TIGR03437 family)
LIADSGCGAFCEELDTVRFDGTGLMTLQKSTNTVYSTFYGEAISSDGSAYAYAQSSLNFNGESQVMSVHVVPGPCLPAETLSLPWYPESLTISANGQQIAVVSRGQIGTCSGAVPVQIGLSAFDVLLSGDGTRLLYSAGQFGGQRQAVWISDVTGANAHPVFAPRSIPSAGIVGLGSVSGTSLPLSPGSYFTIYGNNFEDSAALITASVLPFPLTLGGISVSVNGTAVPVQAVTPWQINAALPQNLGTGSANVTVGFADGTSLIQSATIAQTAAAVITYPLSALLPTLGSGAAAFHAGTAILADANHPASAGEILETYGFGLGATVPDPGAGSPAPSGPPASASAPAVNIGPVFAHVTFAGLVPGLVSLYQVNVVVPTGLAPGSYALRWATLDPAAGPAGLIWVK